MYFIQEVDKHKMYYQILKIITIQDDKIIIPRINEKNIEKIAQKLKKKINKTNSNKVIISKELWKNKKFVNYLNTYELKIAYGDFLFLLLAKNILEYILESRKEEILKIAILVNDTTEIAIGSIKEIIEKNKNVTIVTKHREKFKKMEKDYLEKEGIIIAISNNKRKSLAKADIILNFDFPKEILETYSIKDDATIINFSEPITTLKKRFKGKLINNYEIEIPESKLNEYIKFDKEKENKYFQKEIYEAQMYKRQTYKDLQNKIQEDKIKIKELS